jgi:hypothetical protein
MKCSKIFMIGVCFSLWCLVTAQTQTVTHSGIRISQYGMDPDPIPAPRGFHNAIYTMNTYFPGSVPTIVWTVGEFWDPDECHMNFPNDQGYPTNKLSYEDEDLCEKYLAYFDTAGIKAFLQVEPAEADMKTVIDMIFKRYGKHTCIIGFGVDVEFYMINTDANTNPWGKKVDDATAKQWELWVKTYKSTHKLFLKHPDRTPTRFPPTYRGEIIFNNDCEGRSKISDPAGFANYETDFLGTMKTFADAFYPNPVIFQIGYPSIKTLWQNFNPKPQVVGNDIAKKCQAGQNVQIYWVDFGMKGVLPYSNTWVPLPWPTSIKIIPLWHPVNSCWYNPDDYLNLSVFSLNGKKLYSLSGLGSHVTQGINAWNSSHANPGMVIHRIRKADRTVFNRQILLK